VVSVARAPGFRHGRPALGSLAGFGWVGGCNSDLRIA